MVAFNEQVQYIEKSKASIVEVASCFTPVKAEIQKRQSDAHILSGQVKSALRKLRKGKNHDCDSFMSNVSGVFVLYKSCVAHLYGPLYLLNSNALARFLRLQSAEWENDEPCEWYLIDRNVSIDEAEVNCWPMTKLVCVRAKRAAKGIDQM